MRNELIIPIILALVLLALIIFSHEYFKNQRIACNKLGGVYIESQCFKAELIKFK